MKLKPCPFCGGEAEIEQLGDSSRSTIYACTMCGCRLETGEEWSHGTRWNERAKDVIKNANELQEFINSVRAKAFDDVAKLIKSDAVTKGEYDFLMIDADDLIELIKSIDSTKLKNQKEVAEVESDNLA